MYELYLMRHGIAVDAGAGLADADRPLTPRGEKRVERIARGLDRLDLGLERIVSSPVARARRTAEIVAEILGLQDALEFSNVIQTGATAEGVRRFLRTRPERRLLLVGHDPTLSELLALLIQGGGGPATFALKKGAVAALEGESPAEDQLELAWLATPRLFRRLARD